VVPTSSMALMILASIWETHIGAGILIWIPALALHFVLVALFLPYLASLDIRAVNPSWIIGPIGFTLASGTGYVIIGESASYFFWAGLAVACFMVPLTLYRAHFVDEPVPEAQAPLYAIFAAPAALLLTNWIAIGGSAHHPLTHILAVLEVCMLALVLARAPRLFALPFTTSMAAFTFPSDIAARSLLLYAATLAADGEPIGSAPLPLPAAVLAAALSTAAAAVVIATLGRFAAWAWSRAVDSNPYTQV
jgi:exfoliative toxin A/B